MSSKGNSVDELDSLVKAGKDAGIEIDRAAAAFAAGWIDSRKGNDRKLEISNAVRSQSLIFTHLQVIE